MSTITQWDDWLSVDILNMNLFHKLEVWFCWSRSRSSNGCGAGSVNVYRLSGHRRSLPRSLCVFPMPQKIIHLVMVSEMGTTYHNDNTRGQISSTQHAHGRQDCHGVKRILGFRLEDTLFIFSFTLSHIVNMLNTRGWYQIRVHVSCFVYVWIDHVYHFHAAFWT